MSIEPESVWRQRFKALKTFASTLHSSLLCNWEESEGLLPRDFDTATGKLAVECVNETLGMLFYVPLFACCRHRNGDKDSFLKSFCSFTVKRLLNIIATRTQTLLKPWTSKMHFYNASANPKFSTNSAAVT